MRVKVRAWNGEEMISPDYIDRDGLAWWKENSIPTSSDKVMLYVGRKDRDGNEVYGGDIMGYSDDIGRIQVVIEWKDISAGFVGMKLNGIRHGIEMSWVCEHMTVIGNKFRNPDLIERKG